MLVGINLSDLNVGESSEGGMGREIMVGNLEELKGNSELNEKKVVKRDVSKPNKLLIPLLVLPAGNGRSELGSSISLSTTARIAPAGLLFLTFFFGR